VDEALASGDFREVFEPIVRRRGEGVGRTLDLSAAEEFRVVRFGGLMDMLKVHGEPITD
jgi:hypothetical protein